MEKQNNVIEIAAGWWAARLQCLHHDNGGKEHVNQMAMFFADMLAASHKPTNDQLEKFKTALETCIKREREKELYLLIMRLLSRQDISRGGKRSWHRQQRVSLQG